MRNIGVIILAAGNSSRLGRPKQLLAYKDTTLLRHTAEIALASICRPVIVVLGAYAKEIEPTLNDLTLGIAMNDQWENGMASSIHTGIEALQREQAISAALIMLCDQPLVSSQMLDRMVETYLSEPCGIVASKYADTPGVPVLFDCKYFKELMGLQQSEGAKNLILRNLNDVQYIPLPVAALDVDTEMEYQNLLRSCHTVSGAPSTS